MRNLIRLAAAGLIAALASAAFAQGHEHHRGQPASGQQKVAKPTPGKRQAPAQRQKGHQHGGHGTKKSTGPQTPSTRELQAAHATMMRNMDQPYTGDPDIDFRVQMIPHHQGAIDMARVAMRHARDPWTRQLAESVIVEQQREIAEMQAWLRNRGVPAPAGSQPYHVMGADSYRRTYDEPGTRAEARGQSWAPGAGVPLQ